MQASRAKRKSRKKSRRRSRLLEPSAFTHPATGTVKTTKARDSTCSPLCAPEKRSRWRCVRAPAGLLLLQDGW